MTETFDVNGVQVVPDSKFEKEFEVQLIETDDLNASLFFSLFMLSHQLEIVVNHTHKIRLPIRIWDRIWPERRRDTSFRERFYETIKF